MIWQSSRPGSRETEHMVEIQGIQWESNGSRNLGIRFFRLDEETISRRKVFICVTNPKVVLNSIHQVVYWSNKKPYLCIQKIDREIYSLELAALSSTNPFLCHAVEFNEKCSRMQRLVILCAPLKIPSCYAKIAPILESVAIIEITLAVQEAYQSTRINIVTFYELNSMLNRANVVSKDAIDIPSIHIYCSNQQNSKILLN